MKLTQAIHDLIDAEAAEIEYGTITININATGPFVGVTSRKDFRMPMPFPPAPGVIVAEDVKHEG